MRYSEVVYMKSDRSVEQHNYLVNHCSREYLNVSFSQPGSDLPIFQGR